MSTDRFDAIDRHLESIDRQLESIVKAIGLLVESDKKNLELITLQSQHLKAMRRDINVIERCLGIHQTHVDRDAMLKAIGVNPVEAGEA